ARRAIGPNTSTRRNSLSHSWRSFMALTHGSYSWLPSSRRPSIGASGAEEDGFALEGFDGEEQGYGGIDAGGDKNEGDGVPMIGAGHDFFADQAGVENGDKRELGGELDAWHD